MNLARAFAELEAGAELFCLHKNPWWQTKHGPLLDAGAFVAGLEYAAGMHATVLGKPSSSFFAAALEARRHRSGPGPDGRRRHRVGHPRRAAARHAHRARAHRQVPPRRLRALGDRPTVLLSSIADLPEWLAGAALRVGLDLIEIERIRSALERPRFRERCFTETERLYCDSRPNPAQSYAARFAGKEAVGKALGCGVRFTWKEIEIAGRPTPRPSRSRAKTKPGPRGWSRARSISR